MAQEEDNNESDCTMDKQVATKGTERQQAEYKGQNGQNFVFLQFCTLSVS